MAEDTLNITKIVQKTLKLILLEFIQICERHNFRYYMIDGSLLGTVRHKGFIPWDDDIDVGIPRPDYEKFCDVVRSELPSNMFFISYEESLKGGPAMGIARIYCTDLKLKMDYFAESKETDVWMDVMILYGMPKNPISRGFHYRHYYFVKGLARMGNIKTIGQRKYSPIERTVIKFAQAVNLSKIFNTEKLLLKGIRILKKFQYDESDYLIVLPSEYGTREIVPKEYYGSGIEAQFEDLIVKIPYESKEVLKRLYGDYMTPPPPEKRINKHNIKLIE